MESENQYSKEQIIQAFTEWEFRFRNNPEDFTQTDKMEDIDEVVKIKTDYLFELIEEIENS